MKTTKYKKHPILNIGALNMPCRMRKSFCGACCCVLVLFATQMTFAGPRFARVDKADFVGPVLGNTAGGCIDLDGDGYGNPGDSGCPNGAATDCNNGDFFINPGRPELCDEVDNNCAGGNNEGFDDGDACFAFDPPGCTPGDAGGCCVTGGTKLCTLDGTGTFCLTGNIHQHEMEGPGGAANCFNGEDDNCDGLTDHADPNCQTAEVCNGFDDDNNGTVDNGFAGLGIPCVVGMGICTRAGTTVCTDDGTGTRCSVNPGNALTEGPIGGARCLDNLDNDCDGLTDINDPNCQGPEKCDGLDNDDNGEIDEAFPDLGQACSPGLGQCQRFGTIVCSPDMFHTFCNVTPGLPEPEGPSGITCNDGIDNDCDGFT
ncbi:MAG: putative metal-binding motif-containing protein, partial [Planctomycetota bacterium]